jgi:capsular polysaccharide transport system permease protein
MLTLAETEVNRLNDRVRQDTVKSARHEVEMLQKRSQEIQDQITEFRNRELLLNPEETSSQAVTLLSTLEGQLVANRSTLIQLETSAPRSPQIPALRNQVAALESQVAAEQRKGAGGSETLAPKIAVYNQLLLKQQQVSTMLTAAVTALEGAEATILQQQLYISRVEEANLPDYPWYPYRTIYTLVVLVSSLLVYGIGKVIVTAIREHVA